MGWMNWRSEIPDPEKEWEEFDRRYDEYKDEAVLRTYGWQESLSAAFKKTEPKNEKRKEIHAKLVP